MQEIKEFLDQKVSEYNNPKFIESDPIQIPHRFSKKEDIEIAGFLVATIAWGKRAMIIKNGSRMMELMGQEPYEFVMNHSESDLKHFDSFVHRTFNGIDFKYFIKSLQHIYDNHGGLEQIFASHQTQDSLQPAIHEFKKVFFEIPFPQRTQKHISDPLKNSAAKRINILIRIIKIAN